MRIDTAMILAGGLGTRFKEYTKDIPKPMIEANGVPLLVHIIKFYESQGIEKIFILAGYKKEIIYQYFETHGSRISNTENIYTFSKGLTIYVLDTGDETLTAGRIKKGLEYAKSDLTFLTYGDGISNVNLKNLYKFHMEHNPIVTLTAVRPPARFGSLEIENEKVVAFNEKKYSNEGWINGGFFILNKSVKEYINEGNQSFEKEPLSKISSENKLIAYKHEGLFRPVDTIRELEILEAELKANEFDFDYE